MKKRFANTISLAAVLLLPPNIEQGFTQFGQQLGLPGGDLTTIVLNFIRLALGFLGILALLMVLLGGFRWMLSAGDEERIGAAKKTISSAIIGLVIILLSWAIVNFVIHTASNVSGAPTP